MTDPLATLNSFARQLNAPKQCGMQAAELYGADHRNDLTGKLAYIGDVWNAVCDGLEWLLAVKLEADETWAHSWNVFRESTQSRGGVDADNLHKKRISLHNINEMVLSPLFDNCGKQAFEVTEKDRKLKFKQAAPDALIKYVTIEKWTVDQDGKDQLVERITLWGKNFLELHQDLQARFSESERYTASDL